MGAPSEPTTTLGDGSVVADKYRIERVIGEGGMGIVFAAVHLELDHRVALKIVRDELTEHDEAVERMLREARNSARLRSEHVARVLDVSRLASGAPYIVMEFLEGEDLASHLARYQRLASAEAVTFLLQVCEAVAEAHAADIVHRDLKPENLFLTTRADGAEIVKVLDFGVSKHLSREPEARLTNPRKVLGSPDYMAPEQMRANAPNDVRADIWSLGAVLYELLTGRRPFEAEGIPAICARVLDEEPTPPQSLVEAIPAGLEAVVLRCLRKNPNDRYQRVAELAAALAPFGSPEAALQAERVSRIASRGGPPARSAGSLEPVSADVLATGASLGNAPTEPLRPRRRHRLTFLAAAGLAGGLSFFAWRARAPETTPRVERFGAILALVPPEVTEVTAEVTSVRPEAVVAEAFESAETARTVGTMQREARPPPLLATSSPPVESPPEESEDGARPLDAWDPAAFGGRR
jgi:eukaryotic-like serine/threonine-protein kinase